MQYQYTLPLIYINSLQYFTGKHKSFAESVNI